MNKLHKLTKNIKTTIQPNTQQNDPTTPPNNPLSPTLHWSNNALCKDKPDKMFPKEHKDLSYISEARRMCRQCPVRKECLEYALTFPPSDLHGVWAGLTPRQLAAEAQRRGIRAERYTLAQIWSHLNRG